MLYSARIVVISERKTSSHAMAGSKLSEKTSQVLRLIAGLIISYLFCWELTDLNRIIQTNH